MDSKRRVLVVGAGIGGLVFARALERAGIEDAVTLAHHLVAQPSHDAAFRAYEKKRVARTSRIVEASRSFGRIAQLEGAVSTSLRNFAMRLTPASVVRKQLLEAAEFEV